MFCRVNGTDDLLASMLAIFRSLDGSLVVLSAHCTALLSTTFEGD